MNKNYFIFKKLQPYFNYMIPLLYHRILDTTTNIYWPLIMYQEVL